GQRLSGGLVWDGSRLDRALFRLDGNAAAWPQHAGIEVEGRLSRLDLREWKPWVERLQRLSPGGTVAAKGEAPLPSLTRLELETREIVGDGLRLQDARLALGREPAAWRISLSSDEVEGAALVPDAASSDIRITFSRLQWPLATGEAGKADPAPAASAPANPVAGLGSRSFSINGEGMKLTAWPGLGAIGVSARLLPSPYGLRIEDIDVDSNVLDFQGRMDWQWRGGVRTRLRGTATSQNVAGVLSALGYAPSLVSPKATAEFDLGWAGAPDSPQATALDGQLKLSVEQGRLLTISNTTSASRVFGWFDVDNLKRRFKGDFSDVLKKGLSFDKASLSGNLQGGVMNQALFSVDGPTLKADGQGKLDIGRQQMDQQFTVMVPVSSAVPVAAVVVAGPVVGGAVVAAQLAFGKQIDKVTQLRYHVSGDWANPKVERMNMKVFDLRPEKAAEGGSLQVNGSKP
ncbi:MAG TPA: AsmA-like C-terminal region-containing protein, partial [Moraxellaceae bacterium]